MVGVNQKGERPMKQAWKFTFTMIFATCLMSPLIFAGEGGGKGEGREREELFKAKCAACHGPDGSGNTVLGKAFKIPDLGSTDVQKQSDDDLNLIITKGKGKMPAFDGKLKKEQIGDVIGHIRTLSKPPSSIPTGAVQRQARLPKS
jgi:mono/diheme cytochrome c family protein